MDERELVDILNPFNFWRATPFTGIIRPKYLSELERLTSTGQIVVVTGVRRSGKTTILVQFIHHLIERACVKASQTMYVDLEDPRLPMQDGAGLLDALVTAHQAFVDSDGLCCLILDEVQRLSGWERHGFLIKMC